MSTIAEVEPLAETWLPPGPLYSAVLDDPSTGIIVLDADQRIVHATSQIPRLLGVTSASLCGRVDIRQLLASAAFDASSCKITQSLEARSEPVVLRARSSARSVRMRVREIGSRHRVACFEEVGESKCGQQAEPSHSSSDWLTGLASRSKFEFCVTEQLDRFPDLPFALLLLDLDRFKPVNDTLGHAAGDAVLCLVARRLAGVIRQGDVLARLGGDEFGLLSIPAESPGDIVPLAKRILEVVQRTYLVDGHLVNVGVSIGIALAPEHGNTCVELLKSADLALYHSKASGRAIHSFYDPKMAAKAALRRTNELELRRALALRQLEVHYQPQVKMGTGQLVGFEALVRWRHPERGLVPPNDFLPLAEEIGLITKIGEWVLRTACKQATEWPEHIVVAVNASPLQFDTGHFADTVAKALQATGLPGKRLEIEITEGILLRSEDTVLSTLADLRKIGVRIAMDDFGTGYASLSQLARFPFDKIKIDRSLAGNGGDHPKNRAIVRAIAALGASLGVSTMAEGVEDQEQLDRLRHDGCSSVQGYFFGRAIPASELETVIEDLKRREVKS